MAARALETDYLVIGAGAAGMAFTDTLIAESDARVVIADRRATPGGHWNDAYPFVRLHQPSLYYGVNSMPLGPATLEADGPEAGTYGRATGPEVRAYYGRVMQERMLPSGRVQFLPRHEHLGDGRLVSCLSGDSVDVRVRKRIVDARYLSPLIPADAPPPFEVGPGATVVPVNQLARTAEAPERFVIVGGGKTAMDACVWLLQNGVDAAAIRWIRPRDAWVRNRAYTQPGELVGQALEGVALQMEAAAGAASVDDLFDRLEAADQLWRVDRRVRPTMYKSAILAAWELTSLREIEDVVRLGRVRRVERDRIVLERGSLPTTPGTLHVHCAGDGLRRLPPLPIFAAGSIVLQPVRTGLVPFNAALVAFVEAHRADDDEKNRLCPPNPYPDTVLDWARTTLLQANADRALSRQPDIAAWLETARLNPARGIRARIAGDPRAQAALRRFTDAVGPATARLAQLAALALPG